jgi:dihydroxyacetone kinase phosphoprotein-dependent L subunit
VRAILHAVAGPDDAARFAAVLAGDIVARKKPAPDIYWLALERLSLPASEALVIEDSRAGLLAATACGIRTVVTVNGYTEHEPHDEAILVVTALGDPGGPPIRVLASRGMARPATFVTQTDLAWCLASPDPFRRAASEEPAMPPTDPTPTLDLPALERIVRTMCDVALANERYFSELDAAAGDADFGVSLASGFRAVITRWDGLDRSSTGGFLIAVGTVLTATVGGCSGPIWGTAFMRAGLKAKGMATVDRQTLVEMGRAAVDGMMARGGANLGDKTLLDAVAPAIEAFGAAGVGLAAAVRAAADAAERQTDAARAWVARRGRQSFTGERSRGTLDPGMVAVSRMLAAIADALESA